MYTPYQYDQGTKGAPLWFRRPQHTLLHHARAIWPCLAAVQAARPAHAQLCTSAQLKPAHRPLPAPRLQLSVCHILHEHVCPACVPLCPSAPAGVLVEESQAANRNGRGTRLAFSPRPGCARGLLALSTRYRIGVFSSATHSTVARAVSMLNKDVSTCVKSNPQGASRGSRVAWHGEAADPLRNAATTVGPSHACHRAGVGYELPGPGSGPGATPAATV